jgi:hypothetical protein
METPELTTQDHSDVNNQIAERIGLINKLFKGGLGEFFDKLHEEQESESPTSPVERLIERRLSEAAKR